MKYSSMLIAASLFLSSSVWAYSIDKVTYQRSSQTLFVSLSFEGGLKKHEFSSQFDECVKDTAPFQQAIRLVDTGWDDTGTTPMSEVVPIDLSAADCLPAEVTVFISKRHATIFID